MSVVGPRCAAFVYAPLPSRVIFGSGTIAQIPAEVASLGLSRVLVLSTPSARMATEVCAALGNSAAGHFNGAAMHTPVEVTEKALQTARALQADGLLSVGGGSAIGLGKALALRTDLPQIVLPTTYAGSEMTPILGELSGGVKRTQTTRKVLPEVVIYDVNLTLTLPPELAGVSGMNAIAHAVEALYARDRNPIVSLMAIEGIASLARALPGIVANAQDVSARQEALYGAWLCGCCLGAVGMALHHKLCHTLGGAFGLPHAETHAAVLPHALAYNIGHMDDQPRLAEALGGGSPVEALLELGRKIGVPNSLAMLGMPEDGIERATDLSMANTYWNPRLLERSAIRELLARAYRGDPPSYD